MGYWSEVSILGPVGYGPTTLTLRHSDVDEGRRRRIVNTSMAIGDGTWSKYPLPRLCPCPVAQRSGASLGAREGALTRAA